MPVLPPDFSGSASGCSVSSGAGSQAAVQVIFADRAIGIHRARLAFFRTVAGDNLNGAFAAIILLGQGEQIFLRNAIQEVDVFRIPLPVNDKVKHISVRGGDGIKLLIIFLPGG